MFTDNLLTDSYQRRFTYLRLSVTELCNFRCNYCLPDGYCGDSKPDNLSLDEIHALVSAFAANGTRKIRITGGEPSLRKDLADIISLCKSVEGIETVALTTNGYKLSKQLDNYIDAGLDNLNLSADSLRPETFQLITGQNKLAEVLTSIDRAIERGIKAVKLNAVLLRQYNWQELTQFFAYVKDRPVTIRFIELMQTGDNGEFFKQQHVRGTEVQQQLLDGGWIAKIREAHAGPALEYTHPDYAGNIGLIMPYSKDFCNSCNRLRVSSSGKLHLCLFADDNMDLRPHLLEYSTAELAAHIQQLVHGKLGGHQLHQGQSGSTRHLAMLGG
jgi:GTP 3',8-cyclase